MAHPPAQRSTRPKEKLIQAIRPKELQKTFVDRLSVSTIRAPSERHKNPIKKYIIILSKIEIRP